MCFQLIRFLPDVGSHLSWLETEHTAGILMTVRLLCALPSPPSLPTSLSHPHPLHLSSLHILYILSAQLISCLLSLSFSLPFFFYPSSSRLSPDAAALRRPKFLFPPLLSFYSSLHLTSLYLSRCSVYHLPATLSSSIPPPSCLFSPGAPSNSSSHLAFSIAPHRACLFCFGSPRPLI